MSITHEIPPAHDETGKKMGMWLFLYTEIILFGGLFVLYAVYLTIHPQDFIEAGKQLNRIFGLINTIILLISSFAVAASITAVQKNQKNIALWALGVTQICGLIFLVNKYFEWGHKIHNGIYPNSELLLDGPVGHNVFFRPLLCDYRTSWSSYHHWHECSGCGHGICCIQQDHPKTLCPAGECRALLAPGGPDLDFYISAVLPDHLN
jgi:hypothetical protein